MQHHANLFLSTTLNSFLAPDDRHYLSYCTSIDVIGLCSCWIFTVCTAVCPQDELCLWLDSSLLPAARRRRVCQARKITDHCLEAWNVLHLGRAIAPQTACAAAPLRVLQCTFSWQGFTLAAVSNHCVFVCLVTSVRLHGILNARRSLPCLSRSSFPQPVRSSVLFTQAATMQTAAPLHVGEWQTFGRCS